MVSFRYEISRFLAGLAYRRFVRTGLIAAAGYLAVLVAPSLAFAAVAYDTSVTGVNGVSAGGDAYYTITLGTTDTAMCVANIGNVSGTDSTTNVKIGTAAGTTTATRMGGAQPTSDRYTDLWCATGTFTGTQTVQVTYSTFLTSYASAYSGVGSIDAAASSHGGPATFNVFTTTTTADNAWLLSTVHYGSGPVSASTGTTARQNAVGQAFGIGDSNGVITPAGSGSMRWTSGSSATWGGVIVALEPGTVSTAKPLNYSYSFWW